MITPGKSLFSGGAALGEEQEFGLKKLELSLRKLVQRKPEDVVLLCVELSRLLRMWEQEDIRVSSVIQSLDAELEHLRGDPEAHY